MSIFNVYQNCLNKRICCDEYALQICNTYDFEKMVLKQNEVRFKSKIYICSIQSVY